jgi:hypothetical protein
MIANLFQGGHHMSDRELLKQTELDLVTERFRRVLRATSGRREITPIERKGNTLYKVNRDRIAR